jgi:hypothetical protein
MLNFMGWSEVFWLQIWIGSGFNWVSGSSQAEIVPKGKPKNLRNLMFEELSVGLEASPVAGLRKFFQL